MSRVWFQLALPLCGVGVGSYCVAALVVPPGANLARHVAWFLVSFAFYLVAVVLVLHREHPDKRREPPAGSAGVSPASSSCGRDARAPGIGRHLAAYRNQFGGALGRSTVRRGWWPLRGWSGPTQLAVILGLALLFRLALLATTPSLSDDLFRYVWDGKLLNAGVDPHLYPPAAPELSYLRGPLWEGINHKDMATPYPPLAEALFAVVYRIAPESLKAMQVAALLLDLGVVVLLLSMLPLAGLDRRRVLVYAWNPLVLVQFTHSAHYDAGMILPLLGAVWAVALGRRWLSGLLLGASVLVKLVPAMVGPLFLPFWGMAGLLAAAVSVVGGMFPWLRAGSGLSGLLLEASDARFNDSLGYILLRAAGAISLDPEATSRMAAGVFMAVASLLLALRLWRNGGDWRGLLRSSYHLVGLFLLLNAVVEPWYLTWMVPFLCFFLTANPRGLPRLEPALGWLLLSGLVTLTDLTYRPGFPPGLWVWVRAAEYGPLFLLMLLSMGRWLLRRPRVTPVESSPSV